MISIIIPTLNSAQTLAVALESILQQTFNEYEILIVDGLSIDHTLEIARNYNDPRIKIYSEKDQGIYDAMNKGINIAQGSWIYFLGCDDRLYSNSILQVISDETFKADSDIIYGDVYRQSFNGRYAGEFDYLKILSQNICHQSIFFKKIIFKTTGLFNLQYCSWADWDHNMRWLLNPTISKNYIDLIIAEYSECGFSSFNRDIKFGNEKYLNFLLYGKTQIKIGVRIIILFKAFFRALTTPNFSLFIRLVMNIPQIIRGT
jgi:glycosyltransferase involved in cell wall biosynthesis